MEALRTLIQKEKRDQLHFVGLLFYYLIGAYIHINVA